MANANNYFINEGNKIGYVDTTFDEDTNLQSMKLVAASALTKGRLVSVASFDATTNSCMIQHSGADSANVIGVAMFDYEAGAECAVETEGLFKLVAAGAIAVPSKVNAAADGKVTTGGTNSVGHALSPASADGDWVYVKFSI